MSKEKRKAKQNIEEYSVKTRRKAFDSCRRVVFFLGFTDEEIETFKKKNSTCEPEYSNEISCEVTHIIVNEDNTSLPFSQLYFGVVSGAWLLRPDWLWKRMPEDVYFKTNSLEKHFKKPKVVDGSETKLLYDFISLAKIYQDKKLRIFTGELFKRVLILGSGNQLESDIRIILEVSGAIIANPASANTIKLLGKNSHLISCAIVFTEDHNDLDLDLIRVFVSDTTPMIYYKKLYEFIEKMEVVALSDLVAVMKNNDWKDIVRASPSKAITDDVAKKVTIASRNPSIDDESENWLIDKPAGDYLMAPTVYTCWVDYILSQIENVKVSEALTGNYEKTFFQSLDSRNGFRSLISEFETKKNSEDVKDMMCNAALTFLVSSTKADFLPDPMALSFIFYNIILENGGKSYECEEIAYLFIKDCIQKYPPYDKRSRLYWLKALNPSYDQTGETEKIVESDVKANIIYLAKIISFAASKDKLFPRKNKVVSQSNRTRAKKVSDTDKKNLPVISEETKEFNFNALDIILDVLEKDLFFSQLSKIDGPQTIETDTTMQNDHLADKSLAYLLLDNMGNEYVSCIGTNGRELLFEVAKSMSEFEYLKKHFSYLSRLLMILLEAIRFTRKDPKRGEVLKSFRDDIDYPIKKLATEQVQKKTLMDIMPIKWLHAEFNKYFKKKKGNEEKDESGEEIQMETD